MSAAGTRVGAGFLALVAVWIGVYWLWEPTGPPRVSFAVDEQPPRARPAPDPAVVVEPEPAARPEPPSPVGTGADDASAPRAGDFGEPPFREYTIRPGDTFEGISLRLFGTRRHAPAIARANPFVSPTGLRRGQTIRIPNDPDNPQARASEEGEGGPVEADVIEYTVVRGDTLSELSQRFYGTMRYAEVIFNANADRMQSMNDLRVGQVLRIPARADVLGEDGD
jgi:nucleoid-associated protein YgaU